MTAVSGTTNGLVSEAVGGHNGSDSVPVICTNVLRCGRLVLTGMAPSDFTATNVRATKSGNQSVATATETKVVFDTEEYDPDGLFSGSTYTAAADVLLEISGSVYINQSTPSDTSAPYLLRLKLDGSVVEEFSEAVLVNATSDVTLAFFTRMNVLTGQTVDLHFYQTTGVSQQVVSSPYSYFELRAIQASI